MQAVAPARALGVVLVAALLHVSCGNRTELPQESAGGFVPASDTYVVKQVWEGFDGAADIVLTSGSQVFVSFPAAGQVVGYYSTGATPRPNGKVFVGRAPTRIAEGPDRTLLVADADEDGPVIIVFDQATTDTVRTVRDTSWVEVAGITADDAGALYVADRGGNRVRKYDTGGALLLELADEGDGIGFVRGPTGLDLVPEGILVVDTGKGDGGWIQALEPDEAGEAVYFLTGDDSPEGGFAAIADVAGDGDGNVYVVDRGHATVLKYDADQDFDQRVELNAPPGSNGHLADPVAASANTRRIYVIDAGDGTIVTFELDQ
ncbi:MAG: hypothetical protein PVF43_01625 [Candidatus Eiseniibacteriota bacterium]